MTLVELSPEVGVTVANLSTLKKSHANATRFSTLTAICDALGCIPVNQLSCASDRRSEPAMGLTRLTSHLDGPP